MFLLVTVEGLASKFIGDLFQLLYFKLANVALSVFFVEPLDDNLQVLLLGLDVVAVGH